MNSQSNEALIQELLERTQSALQQQLDSGDIPDRLREAMAYSLFAGGKRIRALLVYAAGMLAGAKIEALDTTAAALECIHTYSLIHDDLPAMDDDELRRGSPTNHIQFDEATAILAGDGLQTLAFEAISNCRHLDDAQARKISQLLATSAGPSGMVGGQMLDIESTNISLNLATLENVHRRKTGALIRAAVLCGAHCGHALSASDEQKFNNYATSIGLAFQIVDDVLDIESSTEELGKPRGSDPELGKSTYPSLIGIEESKIRAKKLLQEAIASIDSIGDNNGLLKHLAEKIVSRSH